jgi:phosphoribosylformylglycinamidine synthase
MHDISDGGIAVALVECCNDYFGIGCRVDVSNDFKNSRKDFICFGESQSRVIVSCSINLVNELLEEAKKYSIDAKQIGVVTTDKRIVIDSAIDLSIFDALKVYNETIGKRIPIEEE